MKLKKIHKIHKDLVVFLIGIHPLARGQNKYQGRLCTSEKHKWCVNKSKRESSRKYAVNKK